MIRLLGRIVGVLAIGFVALAAPYWVTGLLAPDLFAQDPWVKGFEWVMCFRSDAGFDKILLRLDQAPDHASIEIWQQGEVLVVRRDDLVAWVRRQQDEDRKKTPTPVAKPAPHNSKVTWGRHGGLDIEVLK